MLFQTELRALDFSPLKEVIMMHRDFVFFYLNGKSVTVRGEKTRMMLADFLRYERRLTGTKIVCAEGDCGACSVLKCSVHGGDQDFISINSCIATVAQMDGCSLVTVEGLAQQGALPQETELHPIQQAMIQCHGSQCGFCTPGFVVATAGLVEKKLKDPASTHLTEKDAKNYLTGNLCRCTGYQAIVDAVVSVDLHQCSSVKDRYWTSSIQKDLQQQTEKSILIQSSQTSPGWIYFAPRTLTEAKSYLHQYPDVKIVAAGTDFGVLVNKEKMEPTHWLSLYLVSDLYQVRTVNSHLGSRMSVGARVTLSELRRCTEARVPEFSRFLDIFASPQIKNAATLVGNIANASPIADTPAFMMIANAVLHVAGHHADRDIPLENFYQSYRQTALRPGEMITGISFDLPASTDWLRLRKSSQRKDLDIACVNLGIRLQRQGQNIQDLKISMGGVAATPLRLIKTEKSLLGRSWDEHLLPELVNLVQTEIQPISDLRGSADFRRLLVKNLLTQMHHEILQGDSQ
jgi:xanthine dehydrogenase small subunit